jgi:hypothetical protein
MEGTAGRPGRWEAPKNCRIAGMQCLRSGCEEVAARTSYLKAGDNKTSEHKNGPTPSFVRAKWSGGECTSR